MWFNCNLPQLKPFMPPALVFSSKPGATRFLVKFGTPVAAVLPRIMKIIAKQQGIADAFQAGLTIVPNFMATYNILPSLIESQNVKDKLNNLPDAVLAEKGTVSRLTNQIT